MFKMCVAVKGLGSLIIVTPIPMSVGRGGAFMACMESQAELGKRGSLCFMSGEQHKRPREAPLLGTPSPRMPDIREPHGAAGPEWQSPGLKGWGNSFKSLPRNSVS